MKQIEYGKYLIFLLISINIFSVYGWWWSESSGTFGTDDMQMFESSSASKWLYHSKSIAIQYHGCTWDYADNTDDAGCLGADSEDGLESWYLMANCRRAQAVYSLYSLDSSPSIKSCSQSNYVGTYVTRTGIKGFMKYLSYYDEYSIMNDDNAESSSYAMCQSDQNGYYVSVGCSENGQLTLDQFSDKYCLSRLTTYKTLDSTNSLLSKINGKCHQFYSSRNGNSPVYSMAAQLLYNSEACNSIDTPFCYDINGSKTQSLRQTYKYTKPNKNGKTGMYSSSSSSSSSSTYTDATKRKISIGWFFLLSSMVLFVGALFANRIRMNRIRGAHKKILKSASSSVASPISIARSSLASVGSKIADHISLPQFIVTRSKRHHTKKSEYSDSPEKKRNNKSHRKKAEKKKKKESKRRREEEDPLQYHLMDTDSAASGISRGTDGDESRSSRSRHRRSDEHRTRSKSRSRKSRDRSKHKNSRSKSSSKHHSSRSKSKSKSKYGRSKSKTRSKSKSKHHKKSSSKYPEFEPLPVTRTRSQFYPPTQKPVLQNPMYIMGVPVVPMERSQSFPPSPSSAGSPSVDSMIASSFNRRHPMHGMYPHPDSTSLPPSPMASQYGSSMMSSLSPPPQSLSYNNSMISSFSPPSQPIPYNDSNISSLPVSLGSDDRRGLP